MAFVKPAPDSPEASEFYEEDRVVDGYVNNSTSVLAWRPEVYRAWRTLSTAISAGMDRRRYELATLAAARQLRSSYCVLAHGKVLRDQFLSAQQLQDVVLDHHDAGLAPVDVAVMDFAEKVARGGADVTEADVGTLREAGLSDGEIVDIVLTAAARCFLSTALDALGVQPDAQFVTSLEPDLRDVLTVGRPIASA
jgi:uncharacterized peroxidase-related enzyme